MKCVINGKAEESVRNHGHRISCQGLNGGSCHDESCSEENISEKSSGFVVNNLCRSVSPHATLRKGRQQKEMTLEDMYNQGDYDDDDDDSDWEPIQKHMEIRKWFCINCTVPNFDNDVYCYICGEHKESGILRHGFFASSISQEADLREEELELVQRSKGNRTSDFATAIGFDERMLLHSEVEMKTHPHPERPDRLRAIAASLATAGIYPGRCYPVTPREITKEELLMAHALEHIEAVDLTSRLHISYFTPDTYANEHSARSARLAAGLCADLASEILSGRAKNGFAMVRPPGHHAGIKQAMGFCLHNNAAVAAMAAQAAGAKRVLIVDWDVHHGNGTQEIFEQNKTVLYISLHRHEGGMFYPGTGAADEIGTMDGKGFCVNVPWSRQGVGDNDYIFAFQQVVIPIASEFAPDITIISAGFDAARGDPLGCCDVTPDGYAQMTHMLNALSGGKLLVILEGGYNLRSISSSATAVIKALIGEGPEYKLEKVIPSKDGMETVLEVLKIQLNYWPFLENIFKKLQQQLESLSFQFTEQETRKRRRVALPTWWKWGRKRWLYNVLHKNGRGVNSQRLNWCAPLDGSAYSIAQ